MKKTKTLIWIISILTNVCFSNFLHSQQSKIEKIEALIEILNTEERINNLLSNVIDEQLASETQTDSAFWISYRDKFITNFADSILPATISIYDKYLTEEEIDFLYKIYSSEIGKSALIKMDSLIQELMVIGMNYAGSIVAQVSNELEEKEKNELMSRMDFEYTDCNNFKTGRFKQIINDSIIYYYDREENYQIETFGEGKSKYKIDWINNCKYELTLTESNNPYAKEYIGLKMIVNIYESTDTTYKFYYKYRNQDDIYEGELIQVEK